VVKRWKGENVEKQAEAERGAKVSPSSEGAEKSNGKPPVKEVPWSWLELGVKVADIEFVLKPEITSERLISYLEELEVESEVFMGLVTARTAFTTGQGTGYNNGRATLRGMVTEMRASERALAKMSNEFSDFFSPRGLNVSFYGHNQVYSKVTRKLVVRLVDELEKQKEKKG
jgi:hypothetical protein